MKLPFLPDFRSRDGSLDGSGVVNGYVETKSMASAVEDSILKRPGLEYQYEFGPGFLAGAIRDYDNSWFIFKDNKIYRNPTRTWVPGVGSVVDALDVVWADCKSRYLWKSGDVLYFAYTNAGGRWAIRSYDTITQAKSEVGQCTTDITAFDIINTLNTGSVADAEVAGTIWAMTWDDANSVILVSRSLDHGVSWTHFNVPSAAINGVYTAAGYYHPGWTVEPYNFKFSVLSRANYDRLWVMLPVFGDQKVVYYGFIFYPDTMGWTANYRPDWNADVAEWDYAGQQIWLNKGGMAGLGSGYPIYVLPQMDKLTGEYGLAIWGYYAIIRSPRIVSTPGHQATKFIKPIAVGHNGKYDVYTIPPCVIRDIFGNSPLSSYVPPVANSGVYRDHQLNSAGEWFIVRDNDLTKVHWAAADGHWETSAEQVIDIGSTPLQLSLVAVK